MSKKKSRKIRVKRISKPARNKVHVNKKSLLILPSLLLIIILALFLRDIWNRSVDPSIYTFQNQNQWLLTPTKVVESRDARANPNPEQKDCPDGFYKYENATYSICYPSDMVPYYNRNIYYPETKDLDRRAIQIWDNDASSHIDVIPSFRPGEYRMRCNTLIAIKVSGYSVERIIQTDPNKDDCGDIQRIMSLFYTGSKYPLAIVYEIYGNGKLRFDDKYPIIEQSLRIKSL